MTAWQTRALDQSVSIDVHEGPGRLCGPGFLSLPPLETSLREGPPQRRNLRPVSVPTGRDIQARGAQRPCQEQPGCWAEAWHAPGSEPSLGPGPGWGERREWEPERRMSGAGGEETLPRSPRGGHPLAHEGHRHVVGCRLRDGVQRMTPQMWRIAM